MPPGIPSGKTENQASFCLPAFDEQKTSLDFRRFVFPGLRIVMLDEGVEDLVWWCTCSEELSLQQAMYSGLYSVPAGPEFVAGQAAQCCHLKILLSIGSGLGRSTSELCRQRFAGDRKLEMELGDAEDSDGDTGALREEGEAQVSQLKLVFHGMLGGAILVGDAGTRFGVVVETIRRSWACLECSSKGCWHLRSITGVDVSGLEGLSQLSAEDFEQLLTQKLDMSAGHRRLAGFSRKRIAESRSPNVALAGVLRERAMLQKGFPATCHIEEGDSASKCPGCGEAWEHAERSLVEGTIFHLTAPIPTVVESRQCACGMRLHYDGAVDGILNFSNVYLFSYELLNW